MRRALLLTVMAMLATMMLAPAAFAQSRGPSGADGTFNCSDFDTQQQAQAYYEGQGGLSGANPADLDDDLDGVACETLPSGMTEDGTMMGGTTDPVVGAADGVCVGIGEQDPDCAEALRQSLEGQSASDQYTTPVTPQSTVGTSLPDTGGASLMILGAGALLVAGGLVIRRR